MATQAHDEFGTEVTPAVESGLVRMEYYGDGIIPLLVDLEYTAAESATDVSPPTPESAEVVTVWLKGMDITAIVSEDEKDAMEINFIESGMGGDADDGDDDGQSVLDRRIEEELEAQRP